MAKNARNKMEGKVKACNDKYDGEPTLLNDKKSKIKMEGKVVKVCHDKYEVELALPNDKKATIEAHVSGRMRMNVIRILPGDTVVVEMSPYDLKRGLITYRK